jgi:hypothetical protein
LWCGKTVVRFGLSVDEFDLLGEINWLSVGAHVQDGRVRLVIAPQACSVVAAKRPKYRVKPFSGVMLPAATPPYGKRRSAAARAVDVDGRTVMPSRSL